MFEEFWDMHFYDFGAFSSTLGVQGASQVFKMFMFGTASGRSDLYKQNASQEGLTVRLQGSPGFVDLDAAYCVDRMTRPSHQWKTNINKNIEYPHVMQKRN